MSDKIWIRATVEEMRATEEYMSVSREEWEAMTESQQMSYCADFAVDTMNNAGGCGADVVDECEVPEEYKS